MPKFIFEHELSQEHQDQLEKAKRFIKRNWKPFVVGVGVGVGIAGITYAITRGVASQPISVSIGDAASDSIGIAGKSVVMSNVSFISANRQGPPGWVVRCIETGDIFRSQRAAEIAMDLTIHNVSKQINGIIDHANGFHFERICLAG
jgi:hypothetical protein